MFHFDRIKRKSDNLINETPLMLSTSQRYCHHKLTVFIDVVIINDDRRAAYLPISYCSIISKLM